MSLTDAERTQLGQLARSAVEAAVRRNSPPDVPDLTGALAEPRGCFVTLTTRGRLRGCIGTFVAEAPLGRTVVRMGAEAATRDPRFLAQPITPDELDELDIEVSVLSPLTETDQPQDLQIGVHGIYIVGPGGRSGCFLPEVATDQGWSAEEFLSYCCSHKAGLPATAWQKAETKVYLFTSEKFSA